MARTESGWITIGGQEGEDGKRHGGSPVYIENGRITKGAPSLTGRKIDALKEPAEESTHRRELNQNKSFDKAIWGKKAKEAGLKPEHLHQLAAEIQAHDKEHVEQRKHMLQQARKQFAHYGYDVRGLKGHLAAGRIEERIPALDVVADSMARSYPEQFAGYSDLGARLLDMLGEGNPQVINSYSSYQHALDHLLELKENQGDDSTAPADERPWDAEDEPEPDPWGFTQPQSAHPLPTEPIPPSPRHPRQIEAAWQRFQDRDQNARGGGLFGSEDLQGRRGFSRLPDGSGVLITDGKYTGATARIVHDPANQRIAAEIDGAPYLGLIPVDYSSVEPLSPALSWRTEAAAAPSKQGSLLTADHFLGPRRDSSDDDSVPFSRHTERHQPMTRSIWDSLTPRELHNRADRVTQFARDMDADALEAFHQADNLDTLLGGADPDEANAQLSEARHAMQLGQLSLTDAVNELCRTFGSDPTDNRRLEAILRRALLQGSSLAEAASAEAEAAPRQTTAASTTQPLAFSRRTAALQQWRHRHGLR